MKCKQTLGESQGTWNLLPIKNTRSRRSSKNGTVIDRHKKKGKKKWKQQNAYFSNGKHIEELFGIVGIYNHFVSLCYFVSFDSFFKI